jgi:hypothetical protein
MDGFVADYISTFTGETGNHVPPGPVPPPDPAAPAGELGFTFDRSGSAPPSLPPSLPGRNRDAAATRRLRGGAGQAGSGTV